MKNLNDDVVPVDRFFLDILDNTLPPDEIQQTGYSFFGIQGPWYTVGWHMAVTIEKEYGRAKLIDCICDARTLLSTYNQSASKHNRSERDSLVLWSRSLIERMEK